jgi:pSer/pThr/pTyr-binding forkhead associated (FHA) protein
VLTVLKVVFLALLYFFIWRAVRSVTADLRAAPATGGRAETGARASAKARAPRQVVVLNERGGKIRTHSLNGDQLQIGRAEACQVQLDDTYASQFHARIYRRDGSWFVEDLGSTNGTYLNQRRLTAPAEVRAGDRLRIGKTTLELRR